LDNLTRLQYLEAMGIDVWVSRQCVKPPHDLLSIDEPSELLEGCVVLADNTAEAQIGQPLSIDASNIDLELSESLLESWSDLQNEVAGCTKCGLCETRTRTVFGTGNKTADWMIIGEAPGQHEDEQGKPFVGKAGQLLTEMLRSVGLGRDDVFITNILKCRPPSNRDPKPDEAENCSDYLRRQRELVKPKIILAVGRIAAQTLLNTDAPLSKLRNRVHRLENTPVVVVYHPAYLLRSLLEKRKAWQDLLLAVRTINNNN
jgi:uracil-DNA glycosylase